MYIIQKHGHNKAVLLQRSLEATDEVCDVPVGLQGQWSLHLHSLLCYDGDFILKRRNNGSFQ